MVHTADIVVVGPEPKKDWYRGVSLSDLIFSKMKSRNPDQIIQVKPGWFQLLNYKIFLNDFY